MFRQTTCALLALCFTLVACEETPRDQNVRIASVTPPVKVRPSPVTGPGTILSSWQGVDNLVSMDEKDRSKNRQAESRAFTSPIGQQVTWNNDDSSDSGTITPLQDYYASNGNYCRVFQQSLTLSGKKTQGQAKACQQPDGSWKAE